MTVRCQLLVLLFLVSSVVSGPTRSAAESSDGSSTAPEPVAPSEAMTSQQPETPAPVQESPMTPTPATVAPKPPATEKTTNAEPEVVSKISLTEPTVTATAPLNAPPPSASETASSSPLETSAKQTSSEDPATTEQDQEGCAGPGVGDAEGSATETCGTSRSKDSESSSTSNSCIVDDHEYPDGARVSGPQDPCRPCFCHRKRVTCVELRCYTRKGCKPLFKAGVCCPTYDHCPPVPLVNASSERGRSNNGNPEDPEEPTELDGVTTDQLTDESVAALVDSSVHEDDDSGEPTSNYDQDDDDGDDHDHSHHHHKKHHMLDPVTPLTSSAPTLHPGTSFPFLVRGRAGVEVR